MSPAVVVILVTRPPSVVTDVAAVPVATAGSTAASRDSERSGFTRAWRRISPPPMGLPTPRPRPPPPAGPVCPPPPPPPGAGGGGGEGGRGARPGGVRGGGRPRPPAGGPRAQPARLDEQNRAEAGVVAGGGGGDAHYSTANHEDVG